MSLQSIINNLWDKLQSTFSGVSWSKVLPFFLFLIVAFVFWLLIFFERNTEGNHTIPIKYVNMPKQEVFVDPVPQHIDLRVRDLGSELFRYSFFKKRDSLLIDVAEAQKSSDARLQGNELTQLIRSKLAINTQLVGYMPASISLKTSKLQSKTVPVVFDGEMRTSAGHLVIDSISIIPNEATVFGTPEQLVNITSIVTEYSVFENLKATSQLSAKIKAIEGVSIEPKEVDIYIPIHEFTERQFEIPIIATDKPATMNVRFFPSRARVTFSVTLDDYKKIAPEDFEIKISYNSLKQIEGDQVELELSKFPPSIKNPHITPAMVEFLFERK